MGQIKNIKLHIVTDIKVSTKPPQKTTTMPGGATVKDVDPQQFVIAFAAHLKKIKTQSPRIRRNRQNIKSTRIGTFGSGLVLRSCSFSCSTCLPSTKCWCGSCEEDIWWCEEKWHTTKPFLSQFF